MASHKKYIKELRPITFITFDTNTLWDIDNGNLLYGEYIPDESDNGDPIDALLHSEYIVNRSSYMMGQRSMIDNSPTDNYSIVFAPFEKDDKNDFPYSKSWVEIPYVERIKLDKSFSISFMFNFVTSPANIRQWYWIESERTYKRSGSNGVPINGSNIVRTIFKKGNKIGLTYHQPWSAQDYITVTFPNNSKTIVISNIPGGIINKNIAIVMTHEYVVMDDGRYYTESILYWDNRVLYKHTTNPVFGDYDGGNTSSFDLAGNQDAWAYNSLNDRMTSPFRMDQFAVFDYALQPFQVSNIYKKVYSYIDIVLRAIPYAYYQFNERGLNETFKDTTGVTYRAINYYGSNDINIKRGIPGVHGVYGETRIELMNRGMLYSKPGEVLGNNSSFFNPGGDFTIDFFASFDSYEQGVLFSLQDDVQPFRGLCLFVNTLDNEHKSGVIQLSIDADNYIHTVERDVRGERVTYNDGVTRHYTIRRISNYIELWINAILIDRIYMNAGSLTSFTNQLFMFGLQPGRLDVSGTIQHLAFYTRALSQQEIEMRSSYMVKYNIRGRVTVQGIGSPILMRIYSFNSGALIVEQKTSSNGEYMIEIPSDDYINVVAMDLSNVNVRPRIIGPLLPDSYEDFPWDY